MEASGGMSVEGVQMALAPQAAPAVLQDVAHDGK
jgi:hypothetical protein